MSDKGLDGIVEREEGNYGRPHHKEYEFVEAGNQRLLIAQHEEKGPDALYSIDGEVSDLFGGPHHAINELIDIDGEKFLKTGDYVFSVDGKNHWFGGPHESVGEFIDVGGEKFLDAQHEYDLDGDPRCPPTSFYSKDGFYFPSRKSIETSICGVKNMHDKTYFTIRDWLRDEKTQSNSIDITIVEKISDYDLLGKSATLFGVDTDNMLNVLIPIFEIDGLFGHWLSIVDNYSESGARSVNLSELIDVALKTKDPESQRKFRVALEYNMGLEGNERNSLSEMIECAEINIPGYQILRTLGEGSDAVVYQARHDILGEVKLKMFKDPEDKIKEAVEAEGVTLEQRIQARMFNLDDVEDMRHITRFKGLGMCKNPRSGNDTVYLVLEYVDGGSVEFKDESGYHIRDDITGERNILGIYNQFLSGLDVIHSAGKVLKDVKLRNLLVSYNKSKIKIDDLETIAGVEEIQQGMRLTRGSDRYAAPEALSDIRNATQSSDLYSAAVCLLYMLTRNPTLMLGINSLPREEYDERLSKMLLEQDFVYDCEVRFFHKALAFNPENRYKDLDEMRKDYHQFFYIDHIGTPPHSSPYPYDYTEPSFPI